MIQTQQDLKEYKDIINFDIEALKDCFLAQNKEDFEYHFKILKGNVKDLIKDFSSYIET